MLSKFKKMIEDTVKDGEKLFSRVKDKSLFTRIVYAGFLIANADGDFDADEKKALSKVIAKDLPQFKIQDILDILNECQSKIDFDKEMGEMELIDFIGGASGDDAKLVMRIACYIGAADGDFDDDEKSVAKKIAWKMGLNPREYSL